MCPDRELISAWFDGETDGKWMSEIKLHIDGCGECSSELRKIDKISSHIKSASVPHEDEIRDRLYASIERKRHVVYPESIWKRHFDVSFPALLSAAAVLVVICAALVVGLQRFYAGPEIVEEIKPAPEITMQVISLEEAAAYLLTDDSGFDVLITIPSSDALSLSGEPQLIREADYKRGQ